MSAKDNQRGSLSETTTTNAQRDPEAAGAAFDAVAVFDPSRVVQRLRVAGFNAVEVDGAVAVIVDDVTYWTDGGGTFSASVPISADLGPVSPDERVREQLRCIVYGDGQVDRVSGVVGLGGPGDV